MAQNKYVDVLILSYPFQCLGKLRRDQEEDTKDGTKALNHHQHEGSAQKITRSALAKLLPEVQVQMQLDVKVFVCALARL